MMRETENTEHDNLCEIPDSVYDELISGSPF